MAKFISAIMKITSNIFQVGGQALSHQSDAAVYLIKSGDEAALVDAGTGKGSEDLFSNIRETGTELEFIKYIFVTHCHYDHAGGINQIREITGSRVVAHALDAPYIESGDPEMTASSWYREDMDPSWVDIKIPENEKKFTIGSLEISFIHTPGHTPGSSVITLISDGLLILFGQDIHGPLNDLFRSDRQEYEKSLKFLLTLNADILCEGHFGIYKGRERVKDFIESL